MAFRLAACQGFEQGFVQGNPVILEPIMLVEVETLNEFVGRVQGGLSSWRGLLLGSQAIQGYSVIRSEISLKQIFGYSTSWRSLLSGMASFTMEFAEYRQVTASLQ